MLVILGIFCIFLLSELRSPNLPSNSCFHSVPQTPAAVLSGHPVLFYIWMRKESRELQSVLKMQEHYGIIQWQTDVTAVFSSILFSDNSSIAVLWILGGIFLFVF